MNRICELRKKSGFTQKALAARLQVDQSAVSYWESGRAFPDTQKQIMLADIFGVSIDYVLGRDVPEGIPPEIKFNVVSSSPQKTKTVKIYSSVSSRGFENDAAVIGTEEIPFDWEGDYFGLKVKGDSMSPRYLDGDTVIIRRQTSCENGQDALIFIGQQEGTLKKVFLDFNHTVTLKPINQSYRTMFFSEREIASLPLVICGIAVELRRKII